MNRLLLTVPVLRTKFFFGICVSVRMYNISIGHLPIETADIRNLEYISATRRKKYNRWRGGMDMDNRLGYTHDFETMSETTAERNHIKNSEIETREVFERETSSPQNIQQTLPMNIVT